MNPTLASRSEISLVRPRHIVLNNGVRPPLDRAAATHVDSNDDHDVTRHAASTARPEIKYGMQ